VSGATHKNPIIRLRGVRHNNLKNFDLDLPTNQLIVITGLSGSGKSSLAFDTLYAEGQRRYIETFSPYARQFFDRMDKPQVDSIQGIPPAIALEQRNAVRTTRSTVGTMTEICDYMKAVWPHISQLHCKNCHRRVRKDSPRDIWTELRQNHADKEVIIAFDLPLSEKLSFKDSLDLIARQGYQRILQQNSDQAPTFLRIEEAAAPYRTEAPSAETSLTQSHRSDSAPSSRGEGRGEGPLLANTLTIIQDRLPLSEKNRARFTEACEQAYHFGKGRLTIYFPDSPQRCQFSNRLHCAECDIEYREPTPALFSFNNPVGACPACKGFGRIISIDYHLAIPDRSLSIADGCIKPWQTESGAESQDDLRRVCKQRKIPTDVPFQDLPPEIQTLVIEGDPDYGKDTAHEWPRAWYGVKGYFRYLESKAYKMHVRVLLSRYRAYTTCPDCKGKRFKPDALLFTSPWDRQASAWPDGLTLADFYQLPVNRALAFIDATAQKFESRHSHDPFLVCLNEVRSRLRYLEEVGLGYLTIDRPTRTLSGGETERVNLTTCLGSRLVNTLFVLDEPSVGLHARDTARLVQILQRLRSTGNTVIVVEHEPAVMRAANQIVDLGPGHGETGGQIVFQGAYEKILRDKKSLTGQWLSGSRNGNTRQPRPIFLGSTRVPRVSSGVSPDETPHLKLTGATLHNLNNFAAEIPLARFICITGVSGSGKSTLVRDILHPLLESQLKANDTLGPRGSALADESQDQPDSKETSDTSDPTQDSALSTQHFGSRLSGSEHLSRVVLVDQSPLGRTPRSNPAVYIGAFEHLRELFADSEAARRMGLGPSSFSFNSRDGQCERCRGAGFEKIEMQFLSDVFVRCPDCQGKRFRPHILEAKLVAPKTKRAWSVADLLDAPVEETITFLREFPDSRPAQKALRSLELLAEVGLGYLRAGQPINTLSGGESQRLKLVSYLAEFTAKTHSHKSHPKSASANPASPNLQSPIPNPQLEKPTLFIFDEPTTGLHFEDVKILLEAFQRLVDAGHSLIVVEHNLQVIEAADWILDLGPDAGEAGGQLIFAGPPHELSAHKTSLTAAALRDHK
jgi:excinuclease ABC subunit A